MGTVVSLKNTDLSYIYTLSEPNTNIVRYVGKTDDIKQRIREHIKKSNYSKTHKNNWIKSLLKEGQKPTIEVLDIVPTNEWCFWEIYWIDQLKSWNFDLVNIASGGGGGNHGNIVNKKISEALKGRVFSSETIEKMRTNALNRPPCSYETRKNMSIARSGNKNAMFGKKRDDVWKKYKKVAQLDLDGNLIKVWDGIAVAARELNINRTVISGICNNQKWHKTAGGFKWAHYK